MSIPRPSMTESFVFPEHLNPDQTDVMLPSFEAENLSQLKRDGFARLGVATAILDEQQRILVLRHKQSEKTQAGALGPLAETSQVARSMDEQVRVETTAHTLSRGMKEELGIVDPSRLELTGRHLGSWVFRAWPVGVNEYATQTALAVCPIVHIDKEAREAFLDTFTETEEIEAIRFMPLEDLAAEKLVRPGTHSWLEAVAKSALAKLTRTQRSLVELPDPAPLPGAVDAKFKDLTYL